MFNAVYADTYMYRYKCTMYIILCVEIEYICFTCKISSSIDFCRDCPEKKEASVVRLPVSAPSPPPSPPPRKVCEDGMVGGVPCRVCEVGRVVEEGVGMGEEGGEVGCEVVIEAGLVEGWGERRGEGETG